MFANGILCCPFIANYLYIAIGYVYEYMSVCAYVLCCVCVSVHVCVVCMCAYASVCACVSTYIYVCCVYVCYILVKAPLRVLYDKIQHEEWGRVANTARGEAECCICHKTTPRVLYFIVQHKYTVLLLICWCCVGGLITSTQSSIAAFTFQCWLL